MSDEQERAITAQHTTTTKDIVQAEPKPDEEERWVQDALEDDDVREVLKCRSGPRRQSLRQDMRAAWQS